MYMYIYIYIYMFMYMYMYMYMYIYIYIYPRTMIYSKFSKIMMNNYEIINFNILQYNYQLTLSPLVLLFTLNKLGSPIRIIGRLPIQHMASTKITHQGLKQASLGHDIWVCLKM